MKIYEAMIKLILFFSVIIGLGSLTVNADVKAADFKESGPEVKSTQPVLPTLIFKKTESHQFSGSQLKGQLKKPDLSYIYKRRGLKQDKIVDIPENFNEKITDGARQF